MLRLQLRSRLEDARARLSTPVSEDEVSILLRGDVAVYKPNGEPLCILIRNAFTRAVLTNAYDSLHYLRNLKSDNRGRYSGGIRRAEHAKIAGGGKSRQNRTVDEAGKVMRVASCIIGFYDRQPRIPFCRPTAFTSNEVERWERILPMVGEASKFFEQTVPDRFAVQMKKVKATNPAFVIHAGGKPTPFTTLTVNNNVASAAHYDKGDFKDGLGLISVVRRGVYQGGWLVFPEFAVAADLQDGDLIFFNSHDLHGVTPFHHTEEGYERISVVYYYRERMAECGSPEQERKRASERRTEIEMGTSLKRKS